MLVGLMSDTHENMPLIAKAVAYFNGRNVECVLHAGDYISPICAKYLSKLKMRFIGVFGNNDCEKAGWLEAVKGWGELHNGPFETVLGGQRILLMHEPRRIEELAARGRYDVIVYGHTHRVEQAMIGKTLAVNPGECGGWLTGRGTVAVLELPQKNVEIVDVT